MCGLPELSAKNEFLVTFCFRVRGLSGFLGRFPAKTGTKRLFPGFRGRARGNKLQDTKEHTKADFWAAFFAFLEAFYLEKFGCICQILALCAGAAGYRLPTNDQHTGPTENRKHAREIWLGQSIEVIKLYLLVAFPT